MPRREALPLSRRAADETAAVSLIMSATSSTIFDGFVKSNLVPAPGGRGLRGGGKNMQRYGRLSPPPQPPPLQGREIGVFYRFVIFVIIFYRRSGAGVCIWRSRPGFLPVFPGQCLPVFRDKKLLVGAVVDEIPGQDFSGLLGAVDVVVGIHVDLLEGLRPIAPAAVNREEQFPHRAVAQRKQGLDVIPLGDVMGDPDRLFRPQGAGDPPDPPPDDVRILQWLPLEGRCGLGDELVDAERYPPEPFPSRRRAAGGGAAPPDHAGACLH